MFSPQNRKEIYSWSKSKLGSLRLNNSSNSEFHYGFFAGVFSGSVESTREGSGASGEVCRCTIFHESPMRPKTSVIRPEAVSGTPFTVCDCVQRQVPIAPSRPSILTLRSRQSSFTSLTFGYDASRFERICSHPRVTVPLLLKSNNCGEFQYSAVTSSTFECLIPSSNALKAAVTPREVGSFTAAAADELRGFVDFAVGLVLDLPV